MSSDQTMIDAGVDAKWAAAIVQEIARGIQANGAVLFEAGIPSTLAAILQKEIRDSQVPAFALGAPARAARLRVLGLSEEASNAIAAAIEGGQVTPHSGLGLNSA